jgi:rhodanese-related sulfurtransferase
MKGKVLRIFILGISVTVLSMFAPLFSAEQAPRIPKEDLKAMLDDPNLVILDVRASNDWNRSGRKIEGAIREDPGAFESWAHNYSKDKTVVLYCS